MPLFSVPAAYYSAPIDHFIGETTEAIIGALTQRSAFPVELAQRDAWIGEIGILKVALIGIDGSLFLEFDVPRIGSRIDAVLLAGPAVFVIEFKVGERRFNTQDFNQAWDYALDLKNFHLASHDAPIVPVLSGHGVRRPTNNTRASRRSSLSASDLQCQYPRSRSQAVSSADDRHDARSSGVGSSTVSADPHYHCGGASTLRSPFRG